MANDWDLHAVVRGCAANPINIEDPLPDLASLTTFQNDNDPFDFSGLNTNRPFLGLEEIFNELYVIPQPTPSNPVIGGFGNQLQPTQPPPPLPAEMIHHHQIETQLENSRPGSFVALPTFHPPTPRPRRKKNRRAKTVHQMTEEEMATDMWAWRKYGQKPIKGSPYPRNYYRCSTSKGCAARKQVERSISDSATFVVSYCGEHTHPRPTHRNSQAGYSRNKLSTVHKPNSGDSSSAPPAFTLPKPSCSSPSPVSVSSFSPTTSLIEGESSAHGNTQKKTVGTEDDHDVEMVDDDHDLLIPNMAMAEDIFNAFQELKGGR